MTFCGAVVLCLAALPTQADSVVMQNGDRYNGRVLSVTSSNLVLQSDVLGVVTLSRAKIANVAFGTNVVVNPPTATLSSPAPAPATMSGRPKTADDISASLRQLGSHTNLIQKVQEQFLGAASPEASAKFTEMLNDLTTGKMTIADLRAQARDVADQLRSLQRESGEDGGFTADLYLSILDRFLQDTTPPKGATTNSPANH